MRFFYGNGPRLVGVSVAWFFASLPIITLGPATLGAYTAVVSLQETDTIEFDRVRAVLRRHGISAALLVGVPIVLLGTAVGYAQLYLTDPAITRLALTVVTTYAAIYAQIVLIPTFVGFATGSSLGTALTTGVRWTATNATGAITMVMATIFIAIVTVVLTIAFVLVFAGLAFSFHIDVLTEENILRHRTKLPE